MPDFANSIIFPFRINLNNYKSVFLLDKNTFYVGVNFNFEINGKVIPTYMEF